jgi:hypothetical protein
LFVGELLFAERTSKGAIIWQADCLCVKLILFFCCFVGFVIWGVADFC